MKPNYRKLFKDEINESNFSDNGYFIIRNIVLEKDIQILENYFKDLFNDIKLKNGFSTPFDYFDIEKRLEIHDFISAKLKHIVNEICIDCEVYLSNFMIKTPENNLNIDIHQDWSYLDEKNHRSFNIWIPLENTTIENGAMVVVPKSHFKNIPTYRTPSIPFYFDKNKEVIYDYLQPIILNKKDIIIFDNSIIHGASSNNTSYNRIAVVLCVKPIDTNLQFLYPEDNGETLEVYKQKNDYIFYFKNYLKEITLKPQFGEKIENINIINSVKNLNKTEIIKKFKSLNINKHCYYNKYKKNKLKSIFFKLIKNI